MKSAQARLDAEELFHLGQAASDNGKPDEAITLLKQSLDLKPNVAETHYLLGALYAQIHMFDRAVAEIERALELSPTLEMARFQLGLLYITSRRLEEATRVWKPLDSLGKDHPLVLFRDGMLCLAEDKFDECISKLKSGIEKNKYLPSLNDDMEKVIEVAKEGMTVAKTTNGGQNADAPSTGRNVFLSSYEDDDDSSAKK